ncbi:MarR family winged helix-turn-helix transcriptional regulator [Anaerobacillus isosaccharinicus]|uniref:MarR family transcriptional regulator n=1 Tax=Anaerobacillus isosaccharinicus TaxID=1532552 RepID=A0A1S2M2Q9_9BACI|nr:MarR family transcriptional regulator [Anaerobacillus isosaccharinicus]MBA5586056.1 MarR family transcriptional regulator [Anaerobacillus isosaccharinicus]QOY35668.1 MarR family transcriptional regulator [Anaerobacillus isosaccharinicus]
MDQRKMKELIEQYANVYLFATKKLETLISEKVIPMSIEQFGMLRVLHLEGEQTLKEVAEKCGVHKSAITQKAVRLEEKGLIIRKDHPHDRRSAYLSLTEEGSKVYLHSEEAIVVFISCFFEQLEPNEVAVFLNVYEKINNMIREKEESDK